MIPWWCNGNTFDFDSKILGSNPSHGVRFVGGGGKQSIVSSGRIGADWHCIPESNR